MSTSKPDVENFIFGDVMKIKQGIHLGSCEDPLYNHNIPDVDSNKGNTKNIIKSDSDKKITVTSVCSY